MASKNTAPQPRKKDRGIKTGNKGEWTFKNHPEAVLALDGTRDERLLALAGHGFVPATRTSTAKRQTAREFWSKAAYSAEYREDGQEVAKMPDDWTKDKRSGDSSTGHRRTVLRTYNGAGASVRMPSVNAIREYSKAIGGQILDVPVEITTDDGKTLQTWVRTQRTETGEWQTLALGANERATAKDAARAAEAVSALLEARRPTVALEEVGDLLDRHRRRHAAYGAKPTVKALGTGGAIRDVAYSPANGVLTLNLCGNVIGKHVTPSQVRQLMDADNPTDVWNKHLRTSRPVAVATCKSCKRRYPALAEHACRVDLAGTGAGNISDPRRRAHRAFRESAVIRALIPAGTTKRASVRRNAA